MTILDRNLIEIHTCSRSIVSDFREGSCFTHFSKTSSFPFSDIFVFFDLISDIRYCLSISLKDSLLLIDSMFSSAYPSHFLLSNRHSYEYDNALFIQDVWIVWSFWLSLFCWLFLQSVSSRSSLRNSSASSSIFHMTG